MEENQGPRQKSEEYKREDGKDSKKKKKKKKFCSSGAHAERKRVVDSNSRHNRSVSLSQYTYVL